MKYGHGGDIYHNEVELDYSANINPLGLPAGALKAARQGVALSICYPDYNCTVLKNAMQEWEHIKPEQLIFGNGAAEIIYTICTALRPKKALLISPTFSEYENALQTIGCEIKYFELEERENFQFSEAYLCALTEDMDIAFLCNPNNPTGTVISREILQTLLRICQEKKIFLVVDECFMDFVEEREVLSLCKEVENYSNLILIKAFTKLYAMPGLRLGYGITSNAAIIQRMEQGKQPWSVSIPAMMAGTEALKDRAYLERTETLIKEEKKYLIEKLLHYGLVQKIYASAANYIFFKAEKNLFEKLKERGILIRDCSNYRGLTKGYYRIAVRGHRENEALIERWKKEKEHSF